MSDQAAELGNFHHQQRREDQPEAEQVIRPGQRHQTERYADRREQHERDQRRRGKGGPVELVVGERSDGEQRAVAAHIVRLYDLRQRQHHKGERLSARERAGGFFAGDKADERQQGEQEALQDDADAEPVREQALRLRLGLFVHHVRLDGFHAQRDGRQAVGRKVDEQKLHRKQRRLAPEQHRGEYGDDLADVRAQQEADHLADVGVDAAPLADRVDDGGEVVVGQRHIGGALGDVGAGDAHRAADVGGLKGGGVVHAVAGHRDDLPLALPCLDDADFVLGRHARIDGDLFDRRVELVVGHRVQLRAGDGVVAVGEDAQLARDGRGGDHMVAGDHHGLDARAAAGGHGRLGLRTRRVDHPHQPEEGQVGFERVGRQRVGQRVDLLAGNGQHAQRLAAQRIVDFLRARQIARDAAGRKLVERALDDDDQPAVDAVDGGHPLAVGVERQLGHARTEAVELVLGNAAAVRGEHDGGFGRVADVLHLVALKGDRAVTAERGKAQQAAQGVGAVVGHLLRLGRAVRVRADERHSVLRKGAGFVRADDRGAAQRLDRRQAADERVLLHHPLHADGEDDRHDGGQSLGNRGDGQRDRRHKDFQHVDARKQSHDENDGAGEQRHDAQILAELRQLLLQRRLPLVLAFKQAGDAAHLGLHPGCGDDGRRRAVGDAAPRVHHIHAVAERRFLVHGGVGVLFCRNRLAGQRRLLAFQARAAQQPRVGGDEVARFQLQNVAGHQQRSVDDLLPAVAQHARMRGGHAFERVQRLFGLAFLQHPHHRVEHDDQQDQPRLEKLHRVVAGAGDDERNGRRREQD